jgi:hypothetical protein
MAGGAWSGAVDGDEGEGGVGVALCRLLAARDRHSALNALSRADPSPILPTCYEHHGRPFATNMRALPAARAPLTHLPPVHTLTPRLGLEGPAAI